MTITVNSNIYYIFGNDFREYLIEDIDELINFVDLEESLIALGVTEEEAAFIAALIKSYSDSPAEVVEPYIVITEAAAEALIYLLENSENKPFTIQKNSMYINPYKNDTLYYTINLDGSGDYIAKDIDDFISRIVYYGYGAFKYEDVFMPLYLGLIEKIGNSENVEVTFKIPTKLSSKIIYNAINTSLVELDEEGFDVTSYFEGGILDDQYLNDSL